MPQRLKIRERREVFAVDGYTCLYCGQRFRSRELTTDHIMPFSRRAAYGMSDADVRQYPNIATACGPCNVEKGTTPPELFFSQNPGKRGVFLLLYGRRPEDYRSTRLMELIDGTREDSSQAAAAS